MERLDIHMVPCRIQFGNRGYLDKVSITSAEFFAELASNPHHPTTSQPSPGDFRRQFQFLASHFPDVISINLTGAASGTLEAAKSAAGRTNAPGSIHVIDSFNASLGQGQLVVFAAECANAGLSAETTIAAVKELIPKTRTFALLNDLRYAVRGGRLPGWVKTVADLLRLTPVIRTTISGKIATGSFLLGRRNRIRKFVRHIEGRIDASRPLNVAIGHAVCLEDAVELERLLRERISDIVRLTITDLGAGLGAHGGPGTLLVAIQPHTRPG
jgi:DegV family protein with EDD domain